jgi:hypothetical protein
VRPIETAASIDPIAFRRNFPMAALTPAAPPATPTNNPEKTPKRSLFRNIVYSVLGLLALAIATILILAAMRPDTFRVYRSITINAPAEKIYPLIVNFQRWPEWSPYEKMDPNMKKTYSGPEEGQGAVYEWDGNSNAGKGRIDITDATAHSKVNLDLHFDRPFTCDNKVVFSLEPEGDATKVTWDMNGPVPYYAKIIHTLISMDRMVGGQFEEGLASMKAVAEKN